MSSARDLILLQSELDKNAAVIASLTHETAVTLAASTGNERAAKKHLDSLHEELRMTNEMMESARQRVRGGPTVKTSLVDGANAVLAKKKDDRRSIQREVGILESVLKEYIREDLLRLQSLFEMDVAEDHVALAMLLDARPGLAKR
jgi:hypothetical protein